MSNTPQTGSCNTRQIDGFTFSFHDSDGNLDTTTPAVVTSDHPEIATAALNADGRSFTVTAVSVGTCVVTVSCGSSPGAQNHVTMTIIAAPDLSSLVISLGAPSNKP